MNEHHQHGTEEVANEIPVKPAKASTTELLDSLSKAAVVAVFAVYVFGFIVVSIHDASHGFGEVNPLKPRVLAAGTQRR